MTIKNVYVKDQYGNQMGWGNAQDTHGGQDINIQLNYELTEMIRWWKEWGPVFTNSNPTVTDALQQAKVLHNVTQA
jgi:hypothetical protein